MEIKSLKILVVVFAAFTVIPIVFACKPCDNTLDLKTTIEQADLIIIGQRKDPIVSKKVTDPTIAFPSIIQLKVKDVLKGTSPNSVINVTSWFGMCPYGVVLEDNKHYVVFLKKREQYFDTINYGCSIKTLPYRKGTLQLNEKSMTLHDFKKQYGL